MGTQSQFIIVSLYLCVIKLRWEYTEPDNQIPTRISVRTSTNQVLLNDITWSSIIHRIQLTIITLLSCVNPFLPTTRTNWDNDLKFCILPNSPPIRPEKNFGWPTSTQPEVTKTGIIWPFRNRQHVFGFETTNNLKQLFSL